MLLALCGTSSREWSARTRFGSAPCTSGQYASTQSAIAPIDTMDRRQVIELLPSGATPASLLVSIVELRFPFASHARKEATSHGVFT
jgi:hypothetical protein